MGIGVFDQLYTLASDEIHDVAALLKSFKDNKYKPFKLLYFIRDILIDTEYK